MACTERTPWHEIKVLVLVMVLVYGLIAVMVTVNTYSQDYACELKISRTEGELTDEQMDQLRQDVRFQLRALESSGETDYGAPPMRP